MRFMSLILKYQTKQMSFKQLVKNDDPEILLDELKHKQRIAESLEKPKKSIITIQLD